MRIVAQIVKEFSTEYPIYAGQPKQTTPILFPSSNPGVNQQGGFIGGGGYNNPLPNSNPFNNPQNPTANIASYDNSKPQFQQYGNTPKDQLLNPLKARCNSIFWNLYSGI